VPILTLKRARISAFAGSRSEPDSALANAELYQVFATGAPGKLRQIPNEPADPRTPDDASQVNSSHVARTVMVGPLFRVAPQILAAC